MKENSKIKIINRYSEESSKASGMPEGSVMIVAFDLDGQNFTAINGGPVFKFTEAISFLVDCKNQKEVDYFWEKLSEGGKTGQCGWLKDKYGVSWQIVPTVLGKMMSDKDPQKSKRGISAMLKMTKINIEELKKAYEGE